MPENFNAFFMIFNGSVCSSVRKSLKITDIIKFRRRRKKDLRSTIQGLSERTLVKTEESKRIVGKHSIVVSDELIIF